MLSEKKAQNVNFIRILAVLKSLKNGGTITADEYQKAKRYYKKLTGADIILVD